jgi:hypothetical protein
MALKERILQWLNSEDRTNLKIPTVPIKEVDAVLKEEGWKYQEHCGLIHWSVKDEYGSHYIDLEYDLYNTIDFELKKCQ